jgi:hypothetical protein
MHSVFLGHMVQCVCCVVLTEIMTFLLMFILFLRACKEHETAVVPSLSFLWDSCGHREALDIKII